MRLQNPPRFASFLLLEHLRAQALSRGVILGCEPGGLFRPGGMLSLTTPSWPRTTRMTEVHATHCLGIESRKLLETEILGWNSIDITQWFTTRGPFVPWETSGPYMETCLSGWGQGCYWSPVGRGQGCCWPSTLSCRGQPPHDKQLPSLKRPQCWGWEALS